MVENYVRLQGKVAPLSREKPMKKLKSLSNSKNRKNKKSRTPNPKQEVDKVDEDKNGYETDNSGNIDHTIIKSMILH